MSAAAAPKRIFGMGNPLLDISAPVTADVLTKYDLQAGNACLAEAKHMPLYAELSARPDVQYIPGGSTLNTIRVANWQLQGLTSTTPAPPNHFVTFSGSIGQDDAFGRIMEEQCTAAGINTCFYKDTQLPTGTCAVLIVDKERALCANLSACNNFPLAHVDSAAVAAAVAGSDIFYSASFILTACPEAPLKVARTAAATGKAYACNLSAPFIPMVCKPTLNELISLSDIVFGNETEAEAWRSQNEDLAAGIAPNDVAGIATAIANLPLDATKTANGGLSVVRPRQRLVVITQGALPTVTVRTGETPSLHTVPFVAPEAILDTNGAGDAFVGGFLAGVAANEDLVASVLRGNRTAAVIIAHSGCQWA